MKFQQGQDLHRRRVDKPRRSLTRLTLWLLTRCIRLPLFLLLVILEPVITFVLGSLALLGVLMALFWKLVGPPSFPFLLMLCIALGCGLLLAGYQALLRMLSS